MDKLAALGKLAALAYHCFDSMSTSIFHFLTAKATGAEIIDRPDLIEKNRHGMNNQEYQVGRWRIKNDGYEEDRNFTARACAGAG